MDNNNRYGTKYYKNIYKLSKSSKNYSHIHNNILFLRDLFRDYITLPSKEEIFKYNNNHDFIPIINESFTIITYKIHNKDIIYDFMMSYHENKYLCWYLYCIIINIYKV